MTYELAKQLQDAGFKLIVTNGLSGGRAFKVDENMFLIPTLSELIEACGEGFKLLIQTPDDNWEASRKLYQPISENKPLAGTGSTPEEAVAKLWLEINKK